MFDADYKVSPHNLTENNEKKNLSTMQFTVIKFNVCWTVTWSDEMMAPFILA